MLFLILLLPELLVAENLFQNPGLESTSGWLCNSCTGSLSSDKHGGSHSYKVTGRQHVWAGAGQDLHLTAGHTYYFKVYVKILNTVNGKQYHDVESWLDIADNNGNHKYESPGSTKFVTPGQWHLVGGDHHIPSNTKSVRFYIQIPEAGVNYLIDDGELTEVQTLSQFASDADKRIDHLRKADLKISLSGSANPSGIKVEVQQTRSEFGWGSAVNVNYIHDSSHKQYQDFFYDLFEWAVLENALKWPGLENSKGNFQPGNALNAVNAMLAKGVKVRGHNIFWGGSNVVPSWQKSMSGSELKPLLEKHLGDMAKTFRGKFQHWDVENENLHLHFYEDKLRDPHITEWMFREIHRLDPGTQRYLNDYSIVSGGQSAMAYVDQGTHFKSAGVPVSGMGIQSHLGGNVDVSVIKRRLDEVAKVGYPIWITELDINQGDNHRKAQHYEDVMRLYFSHPAVKGVMFWGFWDQRHWRPQAALANGNNVTPNEAGKRVQQLLKHTWRTNESHDIGHGQTVSIRAFKGSYKLLVHHNGKVIHTENFSVGQAGNTLKVNLSGSGSNPHVDKVLIG
ncbi:hypothetical protein SNE40_000501 [Patella caerulea]|uniref:GH10 domain-containing protein n=1 Tax=Patella caerulea TaxID=87958 RepID=A0AAN8KAP4_PATCE